MEPEVLTPLPLLCSVILKFFNEFFQHSEKEEMKLKFMHTQTSTGMIVKSYSLLRASPVCWLGY